MKKYFVIFLLMVVAGVAYCKMVYPSFDKYCFSASSEDSESFGYSLAMSDDYLAVGDPGANHVVLFEENERGKWIRSRTIKPPKGSSAEIVGSGFGYDISLDESTLVIGAYTKKHKPSNLEDFQYTNQLGVAYSGGVYKVDLDKNVLVERVDTLDDGEISGFSVSADSGKIAFSSRADQPDKWFGKVHLFSEGNIRKTVTPTKKSSEFGIDISLKNNLLAVASPRDDAGATYLLFNLESFDDEPKRLAIPNSTGFNGITVAISDKFIAIGSAGYGFFSSTRPETQIKTIEGNTVAVIDGDGELSLDGSILARVRPSISGDGHNQKSLLEVFELDETPTLIETRTGVDLALVHNNLLATISKKYFGIKVCIEPIK